MSLKDKLNQRASSTTPSISEISHQDLPTEYRRRLQENSKTERLKTLFSGLQKRQFVQIEVGPGNKNGYLSVYLFKGASIDLDTIETLMDQAGIVHGVELYEAVSEYSDGVVINKSFRHVVVAKATPVTVGKSGHVELLKRPYNSSTQPDLESFDQITPEEELAIIHPPVKGIPGMSIMGEEVPAPAIQLADYKTNSCIKTVNDGEKTILVSTIQGYLLCYNQEISVNSELAVHGDVTVHRGNLIFNSDVHVTDNILENVSMNIGGSLRIDGMIRQAQLHVANDLVIDKGVFGKSDCQISVGGSLKVRYLNEIDLDCEGSVHADKEILNCHIWTRADIDSPLATFVGGTTFSQGNITVETLGSELGLKTLVVAGLDKREYRIEHELLPEIEEKKERLSRAEEVLPNATAQNKESLMNTIADLKGEIQSREMEIEQFREKMLPQDTKACITVRQKLFPGVTLMIGDKDYTVMEKVDGPLTIQREGSNILVKKASLDR